MGRDFTAKIATLRLQNRPELPIIIKLRADVRGSPGFRDVASLSEIPSDAGVELLLRGHWSLAAAVMNDFSKPPMNTASRQ